MRNSVEWLNPLLKLNLKDDEVHVWLADLDQTTERTSNLFDFLTDEERNRSTKFVQTRDRNRFIATHSILRLILGRYLESRPEEIKITSGPAGKPSLHGNYNLRFNLAHSGELALFAVSLGHELGIDIEHQRAEFIYDEIVENYFSPKERAEFWSLDASLRDDAFYLGWTRKEAYLKACGQGLRVPLHAFDVSLDPNQAAMLTSGDQDRWTLRSFSPKPGFMASLVVEGKDPSICYWEWRPESAPFLSGN
jgi:4'-phosphopantetheinyl transferase